MIKGGSQYKVNGKKHYERNKKVYILRALAKKAKLRAWIVQQKSVPCADCKVAYPFYVMQFDHVRGKKSFTISSGFLSRSKKAVEEEIAKCDVVCANCHAERTHSRL